MCVYLDGEILRGVDGKILGVDEIGCMLEIGEMVCVDEEILGVDMIECMPDIGKR